MYFVRHHSVDEFEQVKKECDHVFNTWVDQDAKFRTLLREIQKKRSDDTVRPMLRTPAAHQALQDRLHDIGLTRTCTVDLAFC